MPHLGSDLGELKFIMESILFRVKMTQRVFVCFLIDSVTGIETYS